MSAQPTAAQQMIGDFAPKLVEAITHLAFYAGWPNAMSAMRAAKEVFAAE
jgi:hypothetical protein